MLKIVSNYDPSLQKNNHHATIYRFFDFDIVRVNKWRQPNGGNET